MQPLTDADLQQAVDAVASYPSRAQAARALGIADTTLRDRLRAASRRGITASGASVDAAPAPTSAPAKTIGEAELRDRIDSAYRLEQHARKIPEGQYYEESELLRDARVLGRIGRATLESERFARYRGRADGGKYYWGHPASVARLKSEGLLR